MAKAKLNEKGEEVLSPIPKAVPLGFKRPETLEATIARLVHNERIQQSLSDQGFETFEEANDFNVGDDDGMQGSPFEEQFHGSFDLEKQIVEDYRKQFGKPKESHFERFKKKWFVQKKKEEQAKPAPVQEPEGGRPSDKKSTKSDKDES